MEDKLTHKQNRFAQLVVEGNTYVDAYRKSYDVGKNTSVNTLYVKSSQMMDMDKIRIRVQELQKENTVRNQATLDDVIIEMSKWINLDIHDLFNENDTLKSIDELPEHVRKCIASFEVVELYDGKGEKKRKIGTIKRVKMFDKVQVANLFLKTFGAFVTRVNHKFDKENLEHLRDILDEIL